MIRMYDFGCVDGRDVPRILLSRDGMEVELIPYGAAIRAIRVPDRDGRVRDVCLGYDTLEQYRREDGCLGAVVGRCANRIGGAAFSLNGNTYRLARNDGVNHLHGGLHGFQSKLWDYTCRADSVTFTLTSPDGEEGYPGTLRAEVTYTIRDGTLVLDYCADSDADTVVNLTNHVYLNLAGHDGGMVSDHRLTVRAEAITRAGDGLVPTGDIDSVAGRFEDLRAPVELTCQRLERPIPAGGFGYDFNYVLDSGSGANARLYCPRTGIAVELTTDLEGVQVYTAGSLTDRTGKSGARYGLGHAVCLETQHFPDAIHHPNFPSPILRAGERLHHTTAYRFLTDAE